MSNVEQQNDLIYVYGFISSDNAPTDPFPSMKGIESNKRIELYKFNGVGAVICRVSRAEFDESPLQENMENMSWLKERALHHHSIINELHSHYTVLPLTFGTIYENMERLQLIMENYSTKMSELLSEFAGKEEWNLKVYMNRKSLTKRVKHQNIELKEKEQEIENLSKGQQFFAKKKLKQYIDSTVEKTANEKCQDLHQSLLPYTSKTNKKKNWDQKITGRSDELIWNYVYLFNDKSSADTAKQLIKDYQRSAAHQDIGLQFEVTGPWPPYHFANLETQQSQVNS